jgi:DNA processing protein
MTRPPGEGAHAAALTTLPQVGPSRLRALLDAVGGDAETAWRRVVEGRLSDEVLTRLRTSDPRALAGRWQVAAGRTDPADVWAACRAAGIGVVLQGSSAYPPALAADPEPPAVLFVRGDLAALDHRRAAIVGTRRCTSSGALVARQLGAGLAAAGVAVVSGLALGIDGAAHTGAMSAGAIAPPVGVVGSGLDVVYPSRHRRLWDDVACRGVLLGEAPPGARPERWRFPARNRILAALAEVVVVVESHARGGSRHTVDAALERGVPVMAVPGSVRCPAAEGTNVLLVEGAPPVLDVRDVLVALGVPPPPPASRAGRPAGADGGPPTPLARSLVAALDGGPAVLDELATRAGSPVGEVAAALHALRAAGVVSLDRGWWCRAVD